MPIGFDTGSKLALGVLGTMTGAGAVLGTTISSSSSAPAAAGAAAAAPGGMATAGTGDAIRSEREIEGERTREGGAADASDFAASAAGASMIPLAASDSVVCSLSIDASVAFVCLSSQSPFSSWNSVDSFACSPSAPAPAAPPADAAPAAACAPTEEENSYTSFWMCSLPPSTVGWEEDTSAAAGRRDEESSVARFLAGAEVEFSTAGLVEGFFELGVRADDAGTAEAASAGVVVVFVTEDSDCDGSDMRFVSMGDGCCGGLVTPGSTPGGSGGGDFCITLDRRIGVRPSAVIGAGGGGIAAAGI